MLSIHFHPGLVFIETIGARQCWKNIALEAADSPSNKKTESVFELVCPQNKQGVLRAVLPAAEHCSTLSSCCSPGMGVHGCSISSRGPPEQQGGKQQTPLQMHSQTVWVRGELMWGAERSGALRS